MKEKQAEADTGLLCFFSSYSGYVSGIDRNWGA